MSGWTIWLIGLGRSVACRGRPGIIFGRAARRRHTGTLAAHPVQQFRQPLAWDLMPATLPGTGWPAVLTYHRGSKTAHGSR
jgi:hypothetical protein